MNLLWFENLLLMRLWVWNAYLVLLWNRALAYPRALLPSGGPLSREFWQLTTPLKPEAKKRLQVGYKCHHVTTHSHELMSLVSINCVNNIECYWSRSHSLSATHCLPWVLSDLFLGQCHQLPLLLPLGLHINHLKPLSAAVVALIRFISHLKHQDL